MNPRLALILALFAELGLLGWLYSRYHQLEQDILMVQGQNQLRYAELHADWLKLAGGIILVVMVAVGTGYALWKNWRKG
ncbi:hypothetical protein [Tumebacillus permanentifrigoris]|uniref:Uncharacterized protein n=1 Tax=Tumebacillus permanentifrigoris TaxID=378543 RepID=A0A316D7C8_9BACL|nr:hypothetical protein [Tumebacillus permanentifrigoris]PWK11478.1 hypothetical protein C7459_1106 [Tumebacillus permanentifrigoris]